MFDISHRRRVWGWFFFDWASQPYNTLLITFIFAPYMQELIGDGARAQTVWAFGIAAGGVIIALGAPVLGRWPIIQARGCNGFRDSPPCMWWVRSAYGGRSRGT